MDQSEPSLLTALQAKMKWAAKRQNLISQNIANADTPGYVPRDLKPLDFKSVLKATHNSAGLATTDPRHMGMTRPEGSFSAIALRGQESTLSGNRVDLEAESMKMATNKDDYSMVSTIYRKYHDMMKLAMRPTGQ